MITKLSINGFKGLQSGEYDLGQDTFITGGNGKGKSRIIEAITYCITGEINGYKNKIKDCSVSISGQGLNMSRVNGSVRGDGTPSDIKKFLCGIIPGYINSLTVKEKIKVLTGFSETGGLPFSARGISSYTQYLLIKKEVKVRTKLLDQYAEETIKNLEIIKGLGVSEVGNLVGLKERYELIIGYKKLIAETEDFIDENKDSQLRIEKLKNELGTFDSSIDLDFIRRGIMDNINKYEQGKITIHSMKKNLDKLEAGECFTCRQQLPNNDVIKKVKLEISNLRKELKEIKILELRKELKKIDADIKVHEKKLKTVREIAVLETSMKIIKDIDDIGYTEEEFNDLELKLSNFEELFSRGEKKKLLLERNKELSILISRSSIIEDVKDVEAFEEKEKQHFINVQAQFNFGFDIKLYKENSTSDGGNLVYEIEQDGIGYFRLSSAQKLLIDASISMHIANVNFGTDFLLVDNGERLTEESTKKLLQLMGDKQIILTRVTKGELSIEID